MTLVIIAIIVVGTIASIKTYLNQDAPMGLYVFFITMLVAHLTFFASYYYFYNFT